MANSVDYSPYAGHAYDAPSWNAGDGYQVPDYLAEIQGYDPGGPGPSGGIGVASPTIDLQNGGGYVDTGSSQSTLSSSQYLNGGALNVGNIATSLGAIDTNNGAMWGNALGTVSSAYNNASTDTTGSVLSGAASGAITGAEIGSVVPVVGTAFGAVIGGVVGGLAGFFGSKSKKKQAKQQYEQDIQKAIAPYQQQQANYLQKEGMMKAAMSPYASAYQPGGFQYKNALFGGNPNTAPQPQAGSLGIPSGPPTGSVSGLGKPIQFTTPQASFVPATPPPAAPTAPQYSGNKGQDQASLNAYGQDYIKYLQQQRQQDQAAAMNPYAAFYNQVV